MPSSIATAAPMTRRRRAKPYWEAVLKQAPSDRFQSLSSQLEIMQASRADPSAEGDGMVVTKLELAAMLATDDDVAEMAGQACAVRRPSARRFAPALAAARFRCHAEAEEKATYATCRTAPRGAPRQNILAFSDLRGEGGRAGQGGGPAPVRRMCRPRPAARRKMTGCASGRRRDRRALQRAQAGPGHSEASAIRTKTIGRGISSATRQFLGGRDGSGWDNGVGFDTPRHSPCRPDRASPGTARAPCSRPATVWSTSSTKRGGPRPSP